MAVNDKKDEFVYRISTAGEWEELQETGATLGGEIDRSSGFIHLSSLHQVKMTLERFFAGRDDLFLLQLDSSKLGEGLIYEKADDCNFFPHFYGPSRSFSPLSLKVVAKAEKLALPLEEPCDESTGRKEERCKILMQWQTAPGPYAYYPNYGYRQSYYNYARRYITGQFVGFGGRCHNISPTLSICSLCILPSHLRLIFWSLSDTSSCIPPN